MTVIGQIPYKDGVLIVADSRATLANQFFVKYIDDEQKIYRSDDKDITVAIAGNAVLGIDAAKALTTSESILKEYAKTGDEKAKKILEYILNGSSSMPANPMAGFAGLLVSVRLSDNTVKTLTILVGDLGKGKEVRFLDASRPFAMGVDRTVPVYLNDLLKAHCPDVNNRTLADALTIAFLLEDAYIEEHYPIPYMGKKILGVGGAIRLRATEKDWTLEAVINKSGRKQLEGKSYDELRDYFAQRIADAKQQDKADELKPLLRADQMAVAKRSAGRSTQ